MASLLLSMIYKSLDCMAIFMEGARGIEPPPGFADRTNGFEDRGAPSTIAPFTLS